MKIQIFFVLIAMVSSPVMAEKLSDLPSSSVDGLRLSVEVMRTYTTILSDGEILGKGISSGLIHVNAYLTNVSDHVMVVLLGCEGDIMMDGEIVLYSSTYWDGFDDVKIKPVLGDYRPIELKPNETAKLRHTLVREVKHISKIKISYTVQDSFADFYSNVWVGHIEVRARVPK